MEFLDLLSKKKKNIIDKSFELTIGTYPPETQTFFRERKRQFTNPVGYTLYQGLQDIVEKLINNESLESFIPPLEEIIRIRAIQDFTPSQAIGFVFLIKKAINDEIGSEAAPVELFDFLSRVDSLALVAFDIYMKYRERLYDLKAKELIDRTWWVLKKWNIISEIPEENVKNKKF